uniref:uncharacterized protein LOC122772362 isoform X5 n=1 Tax=Solea senegalensis TaxID=28829 RepID=UPI001CD844BF|nr:uncharacterized protein LOC122772362 isoform X5 [Solea senegalensis]
MVKQQQTRSWIDTWTWRKGRRSICASIIQQRRLDKLNICCWLDPDFSMYPPNLDRSLGFDIMATLLRVNTWFLW